MGQSFTIVFPLSGEHHPCVAFHPNWPAPKQHPILLELQNTARVVADHHGSPDAAAAIAHRHPSHLAIDTLDGEPMVLFS
jgi:hypothetical protein